MSKIVTIDQNILTECLMECVKTILTEKSNRRKKKYAMAKKRATVIHFLKQKGIDNAPYAYKLWPKKDEDAARSYFYKCRDGKKNKKTGTRYSFTDSQINALYSMISSNSI